MEVQKQVLWKHFLSCFSMEDIEYLAFSISVWEECNDTSSHTCHKSSSTSLDGSFLSVTEEQSHLY